MRLPVERISRPRSRLGRSARADTCARIRPWCRSIHRRWRWTSSYASASGARSGNTTTASPSSVIVRRDRRARLDRRIANDFLSESESMATRPDASVTAHASLGFGRHGRCDRGIAACVDEVIPPIADDHRAPDPSRRGPRPTPGQPPKRASRSLLRLSSEPTMAPYPGGTVESATVVHALRRWPADLCRLRVRDTPKARRSASDTLSSPMTR